MTVVPITDKHRVDAQAWLVARGTKPWPKAMLDAPGFAVDGVAAVWLFATPPYALIECLVANPAADEEQRDAALDAVVAAALASAREQGVRVVYSTSTIGAVVARAERHGFVTIHSGAALIVADLGRAS